MSATEIIKELPKLTEAERRAVGERLLELAAGKVGSTRAKRHNGGVSLERKVKSGTGKITSLPDFAARRKAIFPKPIPAAQVRLVDKLIAGE